MRVLDLDFVAVGRGVRRLGIGRWQLLRRRCRLPTWAG
jgi:hypothetical protein